MRRYSNATILPPVLTVRDTASIEPPSAGLQRSSTDEPEDRLPTHAPDSHAMSRIEAFCGVGIAMSCSC